MPAKIFREDWEDFLQDRINVQTSKKLVLDVLLNNHEGERWRWMKAFDLEKNINAREGKNAWKLKIL